MRHSLGGGELVVQAPEMVSRLTEVPHLERLGWERPALYTT